MDEVVMSSIILNLTYIASSSSKVILIVGAYIMDEEAKPTLE